MTCLHSSMSYHKCDNLAGEMPWSQRWGCPSHSDVGTPAMSPSVVSPTAWLVAGGPCPRFPLGLCRLKGGYCGTSLGVQSLRLWASTAGSGSSTPAWGTDEIPQPHRLVKKRKWQVHHLWGMLTVGESVHGGGWQVHKKSPYLPLDFAVNPKLLWKIRSGFFFFF